MLRNYFKTAFRYMRNNKLFIGLNVFGLTVGLACSILIFMWVMDEISYDRFNPGADKIFRLTAKVKDIESAMVPMAFAGAIKSELPGVRNTTRITPLEKVVTVGKNKFDEKHMYYVDSDFLRVFNYPLVRGNKATVLLAPNSVVVTAATAIKYFGSVDQALGQSIYIDSDIKGASLQVTGVLRDVPANSHLQFDLLLPIENWDKQVIQPQPWRYFDSYIYFQLEDPIMPDAGVVRELERQINVMRNKAIVNTPAVPATIGAQPLTEIHLYSHFGSDVDGQGNIQYVRIFLLVAAFIIVIACINFMNLATALSGTRAKEVGLRKTVGALRWQLTLQFIGESMLLAFISLGFALLLVYAALPFFNTLASKSIHLDLFDIGLMTKILGITVVVGLLAGSYPAFYISAFNVINVLKGGGGQLLKGSAFRNGLVVAQFSISVVLIISTVIIYGQLRFIHNRDVGFDKENLLYVPMPEVGDLMNDASALRSSLSQTPGIGAYTITSDLPTDLGTNTPLTWRGMETGSLVMCHWLNVDENYLNTFRIKLLTGRFYSDNFKGSDSEYVINESAANAMQFDPATALGKTITVRGHEGTIVGVVKDFNFKPVYKPIEPLVMRNRAFGDFLIVRTSAGTTQKTLASVLRSFQQVYGNNPFSFGFVDQDLDHLYIAETRMGSLFNIFAILSIVISCLGLFGLATFATQRRSKEIGIRKVLGADKAGIVLLLVKEFLKLVALSLLVAFPVAWYAMHQWLQGFVYRIGISGWVFAAAGAAALLVAFLTMSYQTIRAAVANPVDALRGNE
jgi:putative ABC transport system permease protein